MAKNASKKSMEQHPIPIKKPVFNKQPSLISSTCNIKKDATHTQVSGAYLIELCNLVFNL